MSDQREMQAGKQAWSAPELEQLSADLDAIAICNGPRAEIWARRALTGGLFACS